MTKKEIRRQALLESSAAVERAADSMDLDSDLTIENEEAIRAKMRQISDKLRLKAYT